MIVLTKKQIADYEQLCQDREHGKLLTPADLKEICAAYQYDAEAIGRHFLALLSEICPPDETGGPKEEQSSQEEQGWCLFAGF